MPEPQNFSREPSSIPSRNPREAIPVGELNHAIATMLERGFPLTWVRGEISNFTRAASGHWYFSPKDARAADPLRDVPGAQPACRLHAA
ncbi:exodeoxyribonuclease VII large subunit [Cupriavidus basilensis]